MIQIPYSKEQSDAFIDSCLYGMGYGLQTDATEYVAEWLRSRAISKKVKSISLNDEAHHYDVTFENE